MGAEGIDGDGFRMVAAGQRFNPSAKTWNILMQMAKQYAGGRGLSAGAGPALRSEVPGMVEVYNDSGSDVDKFNVLGISNVEVTHDDNDSQFETRIIFKGDTPTVADYAGQFVITAEPIASGDIGKCFVQGVCPAQVNIVTAGDEYCDVKDSDATQLQSGSTGSAQILYAPSGTGKLWCVVRIGNDPIGPFVFPVLFTKDGGTYGSNTTTCNATYTVTSLSNQPLANGSSNTTTLCVPELTRARTLANVTYSAGNTTIGTACYDVAVPPVLHLLEVPEVPTPTQCS